MCEKNNIEKLSEVQGKGEFPPKTILVPIPYGVEKGKKFFVLQEYKEKGTEEYAIEEVHNADGTENSYIFKNSSRPWIIIINPCDSEANILLENFDMEQRGYVKIRSIATGAVMVSEAIFLDLEHDFEKPKSERGSLHERVLTRAWKNSMEMIPEAGRIDYRYRFFFDLAMDRMTCKGAMEYEDCKYAESEGVGVTQWAKEKNMTVKAAKETLISPESLFEALDQVIGSSTIYYEESLRFRSIFSKDRSSFDV